VDNLPSIIFAKFVLVVGFTYFLNREVRFGHEKNFENEEIVHFIRIFAQAAIRCRTLENTPA
jgi:hypothetical protein